MMKKLFLHFVIMSVAMFVSVCVYGETWYVSPTGAGDGTSEANPFNLTTAWAKLTARPTKNVELVLADGTYSLSSQLPDVKTPVGTGFSYLIRSKSGNPANCIVDGQNQCRCFKIWCDGAANVDTEHYTIFRGITFKNGKFTPSTGNEGGGMMYLQGVLDNCVFENCTTESPDGKGSIGGAVHCLRGSLITNCVFRNCAVKTTGGSANGGALYFGTGGDSIVADTSFIGCLAECNTSGDTTRGGGAIYAGNKLHLRNVVFDDCCVTNLSHANGSCPNYIRGGAVHTIDNVCTMDNVKFVDCSASGYGGAYYRTGKNETSSRLTDVFTDCSFLNCYGRYGGAICNGYADNLTLVRCRFEGNSSELTSAVAMTQPTDLGRGSGVLVMSNCVVRSNSSTGGYGVIKIGSGATVVDSVIEDNLVNTANTAEGGLLFINNRNENPRPQSLLFENLIIRNNTSSGVWNKDECGFKDGIFRIYCDRENNGQTNIVVRNCYITGNKAATVVMIFDASNANAVDSDDKGVFFLNCNITGNTLFDEAQSEASTTAEKTRAKASVALFATRDNNNASQISIRVRNCDLRGNTGPTRVYDDKTFAKIPRKIDHCAVDSGMTNYSTDSRLGNQVGGPLAGKGAYMSWMDSATDAGDGAYTETVSKDYGVMVTINNKVSRRLGAKPDIGARETDEGGTPPAPDPSFREQLLFYVDPANAIVLNEGETFTLPALNGDACYLNLSEHRFLSIDGNVLTARSAGIGSFKAFDNNATYICTVPVYIKPVGRQIDNVYILKFGADSDYLWSDPENWVKVGSTVNASYPDGQNDIAFIPLDKPTAYVSVDGSFSLAGLYCSCYVDGTTSRLYLRGNKSDGTSSLSFYGTTGRNAVPATLMGSNQATTSSFEFYLRGSDTNSKITFKVAKGALNLDLGGPTDKIKTSTTSANATCWYNDNAYGVYEIPVDSRLCLVNGNRYGSFGDDQMWCEQHINMGGADIFTGTGILEFNTCSAVGLWSNSLRSFSGTVKSQTLNYVRGENSNRSGILWSVNVNAENVDAEINGFTTRDFNAANGVGAWCSGNSHGYGDPGSMNGNGLPEKSLTLNGGLLQLLGMSKNHSDANPFWPRSDGLFEAHYQTSDLRIGKGLSAIDNAWSGTVSANGAISHFIADKVTHADPCGTLRLSDAHAINNKPLGTYRSENTLVGFSNHYVGYKGEVNYAQNIFPIVPWAIAQYSSGNERTLYLWWLGVDANNNVIRVGDRNNIDRNNMQMNQNAFVNGNIDIASDKDVNSLVVNDNGGRNKNLGAGRTLTIRSGGLGLEQNGSMLGTQTGGDANGTVVFSEKAFVFASSTSESDPNQIWSKIKAEKGFVSAYCGHLLLGGDQSGIKGELTINNGTLQLGSMDGTVACQLNGVTEVRAVGGNSVLRINKEGPLENKVVRFECPGGIGPKFKLQNTEQEHCYKFYIDGQSIRSGSWGATGSGAANIDDEHFTGTGVLIVQRDDVGVGFSMVFRP